MEADRPISGRRYKWQVYEGTVNYFSFSGEGSRYFGIWAVNTILTILTLGIYYPWAKAAKRKYVWNESQLNEHRFVFHGTGMEMFRGFIIVYVLFVGLLVLTFKFNFAIFLFYLIAALVMPLGIFGAWRYRASRTSYRGIHFYFDGNMKEFLLLYYKNLIFVIITVGIYLPWMRVSIMNYLFDHTSLGDVAFSFSGKGEDLFIINLLGLILPPVTFGLYASWYTANRFDFLFNNINLHHKGEVHPMFSDIKGWDILKTNFVNVLMIIFSLGLAFPWAYVRIMKLYYANVQILGDIDWDDIEQVGEKYINAAGDDLLDILDTGFEF